MQNIAQNKDANYAAKYSQMTQVEDLEEAFEDIKEKIEHITVNTQADVALALELKEEFATFYQALTAECEKSDDDEPLQDL